MNTQFDLELGTVFTYTKYGKSRLVQINEFGFWGSDPIAICYEIKNGVLTSDWVMIYCSEIDAIFNAQLTEGK